MKGWRNKDCKRERSTRERQEAVSLGPKNPEITLLDLISPKTFALESLPGSWEQLELESIGILFFPSTI